MFRHSLCLVIILALVFFLIQVGFYYLLFFLLPEIPTELLCNIWDSYLPMLLILSFLSIISSVIAASVIDERLHGQSYYLCVSMILRHLKLTVIIYGIYMILSSVYTICLILFFMYIDLSFGLSITAIDFFVIMSVFPFLLGILTCLLSRTTLFCKIAKNGKNNKKIQ